MAIFTLTPDIIALGIDALDSLLREFGKSCRLFYSPIWTPCNNCGPSPVGNVPTTVWVNGGVAYFPNGSLCPLCNGNGRLQTEKYDDITLLLNWVPKEFDKAWLSQIQRLPQDVVQAKGMISDMPKVSQCVSAQFDLALSAYMNCRFKLISQPISPGNIIQHRYFTSIWERIPS